MRPSLATAGLAAVFLASHLSYAQSAPESTEPPAQEPVGGAHTASQIPNVAYAYTAYGTLEGTMGVQAYALGLAAAAQDSVLGGGGAVWGSPIKRLTLIADAQRNVSRNFSPSAAAVVTLLGSERAGFSLAGMGKFKIDGFAAGPSHDEVESELELGMLASVVESGWYLDFNAVAGRGLGDDGETDAEGRLRFARAIGSFVRLGIDGQVRDRLSGPRYLPNGRTWDFALGPQALFWVNHFYGSLTTGPTTMGLTSSNVGWVAMASFGGTTF